ncbi:hypothetical protein CR513_10957, partial [Mucuna pruriens]
VPSYLKSCYTTWKLKEQPRGTITTQESKNYWPNKLSKNCQPLIRSREKGPQQLRKTLGDYVGSNGPRCFLSIVHLVVNDARTFELKLALLQLFIRIDHKDPNTHLSTFLELCDTMHKQGVPEEAVKWINLFVKLGRDSRHYFGNVLITSSMNKKTKDEALVLIETMSLNDYMIQNERGSSH